MTGDEGCVGVCDHPAPHPEHPCGRRMIAGVTRCSYCGNFDGSPECAASGCWEPITAENAADTMTEINLAVIALRAARFGQSEEA